MNKRLNYIAIALTTDCNYKCFYCKKTGESIEPNIKGTWNFNNLKNVIRIAYSFKLTTFRITGGEPTIVDYLPQLISYIMNLGEDTVITKYNYIEVTDLIDTALKLGVNVKILDLIVRNEYLGIEKKLNSTNAYNFGKSSYQLLNDIKEYLDKISDNYKENWSISGNSNGIPMDAYFFDTQWVQVKDSTKGARYSKECRNCTYYNCCYEGVFSPLLSVGEILNISGCMNKKLHYILKGKSDYEKKQAFAELLKLFENTELRKHV